VTTPSANELQRRYFSVWRTRFQSKVWDITLPYGRSTISLLRPKRANATCKRFDKFLSQRLQYELSFILDLTHYRLPFHLMQCIRIHFSILAISFFWGNSRMRFMPYQAALEYLTHTFALPCPPDVHFTRSGVAFDYRPQFCRMLKRFDYQIKALL
jgi:hypothetical protein